MKHTRDITSGSLVSRRSPPRSRLGAALLGGLGGIVGAACMTPLRILSRRAGLIDRTVPQAIESTLAHRLGGQGRTSPVVHHVIDHLLHFGYGAVLGVGYGAVTGERRRRWSGIVTHGVTYGTATWLLGSAVILPALRAARPLWRARRSEALTDVAAMGVDAPHSL